MLVTNLQNTDQPDDETETAVAEAIVAEIDKQRRTRDKKKSIGMVEVLFITAWAVALVNLMALALLPRRDQVEDVFYWPVFVTTFSVELFWIATACLSVSTVLYNVNWLRASFLKTVFLYLIPWIIFFALPVALSQRLEQVGHAHIDGQIYYIAQNKSIVSEAFEGVIWYSYACDRYGFDCTKVGQVQVSPPEFDFTDDLCC